MEPRNEDPITHQVLAVDTHAASFLRSREHTRVVGSNDKVAAPIDVG